MSSEITDNLILKLLSTYKTRICRIEVKINTKICYTIELNKVYNKVGKWIRLQTIFLAYDVVIAQFDFTS